METRLFMFNSNKEFWNPVMRVYQKEPVSMTETDMMLTHSMAINSDDTVNIIRYEGDDHEKEVVLKFIRDLKTPENYIKIVKDMNRDIMRLKSNEEDNRRR